MNYLKLAVLTVTLALATSSLVAKEDSTVAISPTAPMELFNGRDFTGWEFFHNGNPDPKSIWSVENGVMKCVGKPAGYARTTQAYKNYQVVVEWRFIKAGNTGVMVHMQLPDAVWPTCIECQGMHDHQGDFWLQGGSKAKASDGMMHDGAIKEQKGVIMRDPSNEKPVGEWNTFKVICRDATVQIIVNGKPISQVTECSVSSGFIGLQSEGAGIEIRKVTLEPLHLN